MWGWGWGGVGGVSESIGGLEGEEEGEEKDEKRGDVWYWFKWEEMSYGGEKRNRCWCHVWEMYMCIPIHLLQLCMSKCVSI